MVRYDLTELGNSRPFFEFGGLLSPGQRVTSTRVYGAGLSVGVGQGMSSITSGSIFGRIGWVVRPTPQDEAAVAVELVRGWQRFDGYAERLTPENSSPMVASSGVDRLGIVKFGGQWTHLWGARVETQLNLAGARSLGSASGLNPVFATGPLGTTLLHEATWAEYGARIGFRVEQNVVIDVFTNATLGAGVRSGIRFTAASPRGSDSETRARRLLSCPGPRFVTHATP